MKRFPYFFAGLMISCVSLTTAFAGPLLSGIDLSGMDNTVRPQDDFFRYANGSWLKHTEIPADKSRYGSFTILYDQSQQDIRKIVDALAVNEKLIGDEKKVADYYASYMDEARVNELGFTPLKAKLTEIDAIGNLEKLAAYFGEKSGGPVPFGFYINQDRKQSTRYAAYLTQGGLGLPDRDYYLVDSKKFAAIRTKYQQHLKKACPT